MSKTKGLLHECDCCGSTEFTPYIGKQTEGKKEPAGSEYFHQEVYKTAEGWGYTPDVGELCPICARSYKRMIENFKARVVKKEAEQ